MPYSYATYTGNGANTQFAVPFPYIRREHVVVSLDYVSAVFTWVNNTTVQVSPAPANAVRVEVRRVTPVNTPLVDFTDGSTLVAADLDTNALQQTYINQEQDDQIQQGIYVDANGNLTAGNQVLKDLLDPVAPQDAATKNYTDTRDALKVSKAGDTMTGALAMSGQKITGLGDPTNAQDAVTKTWVETAGASPLVQFRSIFYGALAADPAVDPYGAARTEGDLYFNSTLDQMRVFNGTTWQEASADATITRFKFTAVGGETSLSGNDDNAQSLTYNVGLEMVYINGALMTRGVDYVATTGSSITGLAALSAADLVEVVAFSQINAVGSIPSANSTFLQSGTGAVQRTVDSKLKDVVSVKDFGAVGDGVADDTAAIQAAITYVTKQKLHFPAGNYLVTSPISKTISGNGSISIFGDGENVSVIRLNTGNDGLTFTLDGNWWFDAAGGQNTGLHFERLTLSTTNANAGFGVNIIGSSVAGRPGPKVSFANVEFRGSSTFNHNWNTQLKILDCQDTWLTDCRFVNGGPGNVSSNGVWFGGTAVGNSPTVLYVDNCEFLYGNIQLAVLDFVEGVYVTQTTMVGGVVGISQTPSTGESGLHFMGGHIASSLNCIALNNLFDFEIIGALLYRTGTTPNFSAIKSLNGGRFVISGNVFTLSNESGFNETGILIESSVNEERFGGYIGGNSFHSIGDRAIWLGAGSNYIDVGVNTYRQCGTRVLNQGSNNSNASQPHVYPITAVRTLAGGAATENVDITIPTGLFRVKPGAGLLSVTSGGALDVTGNYDHDNSTATMARFVMRNPAGGNISAGTYRFSIALFEDTAAGAF